MAIKNERIEVTVSVRLTKSADDTEIAVRCNEAIYDALERLANLPGAKRLSAGWGIGPLKQDVAGRRHYHRRVHPARRANAGRRRSSDNAEERENQEHKPMIH